LAAGLLAALLAGGCTVGPNFVPPPAPRVERFVAPDDPHAASGPWTGDGRTQALSPDAPLTRDWWTRFGSRAIDASVDAALTGSPTLALAEATLRRSEHALRAGQGVFFPQIDAQAGAARERATPSRGPALPASIFNLFALSATVSYTLDLWGGERRQVEALAAGVDAQRHALAGAYLMLSANVVNTMIARAAYRDEAAATRETIGLVDEQIRLTRAQVTAGAAAYVAVLTLESQRATLQATLPALDQKRAQADDLLALLAGRYPADWRTPELSLAAIELPASLPDTAPSSLVRRRPDIQQAEAELHVASAQVGVATAALYPNLTLSASGGFDSGVAANLFSPAGRAWSVGAGVTAPLFHGGTLLNQRRAAQDAYDEADASYRQVVLAAFSRWPTRCARSRTTPRRSMRRLARWPPPAMRCGSRRPATTRGSPATCRCWSPTCNITRPASRGFRRSRNACRIRSRSTSRSAAAGAKLVDGHGAGGPAARRCDALRR
jgi:NodT family efflux transporter outer membrane factor (OMF) lipoprotein